MTVANAAHQNLAREIAVFDDLAAAGRHGGLSVREYTQFFHQIGLTGFDRQSRIIDLGCGDGLMACVIAGLGFGRVTGVDISPGNIAIARRRAGREGVDIDFRVDDISDLSWIASHTYDLALMSGTLHHFPTFKAKRAVVAEVQRMLRPSGLFAGIEPNRWNPYWYIPILMMKLTWSRLPVSFRYVKCNCTENEQNQLSPRELEGIFRDLRIKGGAFEPFSYVKPRPEERRYHGGVVALYRDAMERLFSKLIPRPHNTSYFVFKARMS